MHFRVRQNWMAASLKTAGRPARPLGAAGHWSWRSSQTISELQRLSEALYAGQFVVRYPARGGLLMSSGYQDYTLSRTRDEELCNNASSLGHRYTYTSAHRSPMQRATTSDATSYLTCLKKRCISPALPAYASAFLATWISCAHSSLPAARLWTCRPSCFCASRTSPACPFVPRSFHPCLPCLPWSQSLTHLTRIHR
jgi:hypothetical protein